MAKKATDAKKNLRARSAKRCEEKKKQNRQTQQARETFNRTRKPTPWQRAEMTRAKQREPLRKLWEKRNTETALSAS